MKFIDVTTPMPPLRTMTMF